ncbi:MAG: hypothetical protein IJD79_03965 [Clostridia bacterium]|nr:hypothetical protein [Clostridia bacterium]
MKKLLALMLVLVLAFAIVSCTLFGGDKDNGGNNDGTNDSNDTNDGGNSDNTDDGDNLFGDDEGIELPIVDITD